MGANISQVTPPVGRMPSFRGGQTLSAADLNAIARAIDRLHRGVSPPRQIHPVVGGVGGGTITQFRYKAMAGDYVLGVEFDGESEKGGEVKIAKPYLLRRTPFDGKTREGVSYDYSSDVERTAVEGAFEQVELVVEPYVEDDLIFAAGVHIKIEEITFLFVDINADARAWMRKGFQ